MALDKKRFRVDQVELGEDTGLWRLYEKREVSDKEKQGREKSAWHVWQPVKTFQTERDAIDHAETMR